MSVLKKYKQQFKPRTISKGLQYFGGFLFLLGSYLAIGAIDYFFVRGPGVAGAAGVGQMAGVGEGGVVAGGAGLITDDTAALGAGTAGGRGVLASLLGGADTKGSADVGGGGVGREASRIAALALLESQKRSRKLPDFAEGGVDSPPAAIGGDDGGAVGEGTQHRESGDVQERKGGDKNGEVLYPRARGARARGKGLRAREED
jgi:hypothetical protein